MHVFISLMMVAFATARIAPLLENSEPIPGKYIIKLSDEFNLDEIVSTVRLSGGKVGHIYRNVLNGFAAELADNVLDIVRQLPAVEYVEQDGIYRTQGVASWGLDRIDQRSGLDDNYNPPRTGSGRTVYVVDTGIRHSHNDYGNRASYHWDYQSSNGGEDCNGHGTHCAGTVGGTTYGVAPGVTLKSIRVLSCWGSGSNSNVIAGVNSVPNNGGVISMSLGGGTSTALDEAVENSVNNGNVVVVAAGNDNANACNYSPARVSSAVTVGSTTNADARSSFSNYGSCVDIYAPGTSITSTWHTSNWATNTISGTSMACPHVAGAAALLRARGVSANNVPNTLTNAATSNCLSNLGSGCPNRLLYVS